MNNEKESMRSEDEKYRYLSRGKRLDNGEWETGFLVILRMNTSNEEYYIADKMTGYLTPIDPASVGQCTGLKNGIFTFEGEADDLSGFMNRPAGEEATECVNGTLIPGDMVISTPGDTFACLVGKILEIKKLGTLEQKYESGNDCDNVHVDFLDADYSEKRIKEIEAAFTRLFETEKKFDDCSLGDVIMTPDCLIRITDIEADEYNSLLESHESAAAFCESVLLVQKLKERLTQNLSDYHSSLQHLDKWALINEAGMISAMADTHYYLTENYVFEDSEAMCLLKFPNPLKVVADAWHRRTSDMSDFTFALYNL